MTNTNQIDFSEFLLAVRCAWEAAVSYTVTVTPEAHSVALRLARGCYQRALVSGREAWSGATLEGKAKSYGFWYSRSRDNFVARMRKAGLICEWVRGAHNRLILVIS